MKRDSASLQTHDSRRVASFDDHALGTLRYIRGSIEAASSFDVPGLAGIAMGTIGAVAAVFAPEPDFSRRWLMYWLATALVAFASGTALMMRAAAHSGRMLYRGPARKFFLCLLPALGAGAILTFALEDTAAHLLPGTWLLLYGCGVLSASIMTTRLVSAMGGLFAILGIAAFELPSAWANALLGAGFGGLHLIFGIAVGRFVNER